jgi:hypothetical protein
LHRHQQSTSNSPITSELYFWEAVTFFKDLDLLGAARTVATVLVVDLNLFFWTTSAGQRGGEGRVASFVTFPSDALGSDLSFYSSTSSLVDDVAPVRRWEDAERDRDFGVKVQGDCWRGLREV